MLVNVVVLKLTRDWKYLRMWDMLKRPRLWNPKFYLNLLEGLEAKFIYIEMTTCLCKYRMLANSKKADPNACKVLTCSTECVAKHF